MFVGTPSQSPKSKLIAYDTQSLGSLTVSTDCTSCGRKGWYDASASSTSDVNTTHIVASHGLAGGYVEIVDDVVCTLDDTSLACV